MSQGKSIAELNILVGRDLLAPQVPKGPSPNWTTPKVIQEVDPSRLRLDPGNARQTFEDIPGLAASVAARGLLEAVHIIPDPDNPELAIVKHGARRFTAFLLMLRQAEEGSVVARSTTVSCVVRLEGETNLDRQMEQLAHNLERADIPPFEEAAQYQSWIDEHGLSSAEIAAQLGGKIDSTYVDGRLNLLRLNEIVREHTEAGRLEITYAQQIGRLPKEEQTELARLVVTGQLKGTDVSSAVSRILGTARGPRESARPLHEVVPSATTPTSLGGFDRLRDRGVDQTERKREFKIGTGRGQITVNIAFRGSSQASISIVREGEPLSESMVAQILAKLAPKLGSETVTSPASNGAVA